MIKFRCVISNIQAVGTSKIYLPENVITYNTILNIQNHCPFKVQASP